MERYDIEFGMYGMEYRGGAVQSELAVVPYKIEYYPEYCELINSAYYEIRRKINLQPYGGYCASPEEIAEELEQSREKGRGDICLLFDGGRLAGAVSFAVDDYCGDIHDVAVSLSHRRKGFGRALVLYAVSRMQKLGAEKIGLSVIKENTAALTLYRSLGFEVVSETTAAGVCSSDENGEWTFEFTSTGGLDLR